MRTLVVLALAWCCSAQFVVPYNNLVPAYPWAVKYGGTDAFGQTTFGHHAIDQTRHEVRLADGRVVGHYSYIDTNGEPAVTYYEAGPNGYRVLGSNILPEAPTADLVAPEPVEYTAEVAAARDEFLNTFQAIATGEYVAPELPTADLVAPEPVGYTAEVAAARDEFLMAFQKAATGDSAVPAAAEEPVAVEQSRKKRYVAVPLPYFHAVPTEVKHTVETKQFETVDAATPADTTKIELTTKEHVFKVPSFKYVQPVINVKQYTAAVSPAGVLPYYGSFPYHPFAFSGLHYPTLLNPSVKEE